MAINTSFSTSLFLNSMLHDVKPCSLSWCKGRNGIMNQVTNRVCENKVRLPWNSLAPTSESTLARVFATLYLNETTFAMVSVLY